MRIIVLADLPPYVQGGAETQALRLSEQWLIQGHSVEVAGHRTPSGRMLIGKTALRVHHLPILFSRHRILRALSYFLSVFVFLLSRRRSFDVIYCRFLGEAALSVCVLKAAGLLRHPLIAVPASASGFGDIALLKSLPCHSGLIRLLNRHCDAINVIAPAIANDLRQIGLNFPHRSHIPNGVSLPITLNPHVPQTPRRFLYVGRLEWEKGLDILFEAMAMARRLGADFRLTVIGAGKKCHALKEQCQQEGLDEVVDFLGPLDNVQVLAFMSRADVFVLPSRFEGLSNAALEALASGLPIIATACGGIDCYLTEDQGWVCPTGDIESLANAICDACSASDERLVAMGKAAHELAHREFSLEEAAKKHLLLFGRLLNGDLSTARN